VMTAVLRKAEPDVIGIWRTAQRMMPRASYSPVSGPLAGHVLKVEIMRGVHGEERVVRARAQWSREKPQPTWRSVGSGELARAFGAGDGVWAWLAAWGVRR
jgi:hypothetical protein